MIRWEPIQLKFTLGIGCLASAALISKLFKKQVPVWLVVGIVVMPFVIFLLADPEKIPRSVARSLQIVGSVWYLSVNGALLILCFLLSDEMTPGWFLGFIGQAIGSIPCLIVIKYNLRPKPPDEKKGFPRQERDDQSVRPR